MKFRDHLIIWGLALAGASVLCRFVYGFWLP